MTIGMVRFLSEANSRFVPTRPERLSAGGQDMDSGAAPNRCSTRLAVPGSRPTGPAAGPERFGGLGDQ
jgi:hypothetical protein